jgi:hypothetical protein
VRALVLVYAIAFTALVGAPLLVAPLAWARAIGWRIPEPTGLAVYFGRCLGGVVIAIAAVAAATSGDPAAVRVILDVIAAALGAMTIVHAHGWIRGTQPRFEDLETIGYAALFLVTIAALR